MGFCIEAPSGDSQCIQQYPGDDTTIKDLKDIFQEEFSIPADQIDFFLMAYYWKITKH